MDCLTEREPSVDEVVGFATAMRKHMISVDIQISAIDLCGTGGSGKERFNLSTAAAFVVSACGVPVAKHGNRGSTKPNGSFDFIESLGINFDLKPSEIKKQFDATQLCFLFARNHHPSVRHVATARKKFGKRSLLNIVGPLSNPANVKYQIIGTTNESTAQKIAKSSQVLGTIKTLVITGSNGLDELTPYGQSSILEVSPHTIEKQLFNASDLNLSLKENHIVGRSAQDNANVFTDILNRKDIQHPIAQTIALNAGAALYCYGKTGSISDGYLMALNSIKNGDALAKLKQLQTLAIS